MIEVRELTKSYGSFRALKGLSFSVGEGEILGFLGPNGAGKSTTLRILAGYLGPTSGDVRIGGFSVVDEPIKAKQRIGYMPETAPLYPEMRVREYLSFRAELKGVRRADRASSVKRALADAGLEDMDSLLIGHLSKGYRQRVGLADALVASPPLLILDEPTAGLDPNQIRDVRALIKRLRDKHTIVISTHILSEVEAVCTRGIVIARGEVVAQGSLDELYDLKRAARVRLAVRGKVEGLAETLASVEGVARAEHVADSRDRTRFDVTFTSPEVAEATTERVVSKLVGAGLGVLEVVPQSSLEQVFADLTSADPAELAHEGADH
jgi:ABC-2 type transport system ATP-binding protein